MGALASRSLTPLLRRMVAANRALDIDLATSGLLDGTCICGVPMRLHRLTTGAQISCRDAMDRVFIEGELPLVAQAHERRLDHHDRRQEGAR